MSVADPDPEQEVTEVGVIEEAGPTTKGWFDSNFKAPKYLLINVEFSLELYYR